MKTETKPTEKKAYHEPQLRSFGTVSEGTQASILSGFTRDGGTSASLALYSAV